MSIQTLYESIYQENIAFIRSGDVSVDEYLGDGVTDTRRGLSLIIPLNQITNGYEALIRKFQFLEPEQYYYPLEDLHITVFDFIGVHKTYTRSASLEHTCINITNEAAESLSRISILFKGIVFSRAAGILKGYDDGFVVALRKRIRQRFKENGLPNTERYESASVHSTCMRFTKRIDNVKAFVDTLEALKEVELGTEKVKSMVLVEHDWYNRKNVKRTIKEFKL
jgi:hypothetical protein